MRVLTAIELAIGAAALLLIFFLVLVQALQRYLPVDGWSWTGELARFCLVWLTFVVAGVLVSSDSHIAIEMIDAVRSPTSAVVRVISCLVVAAVGVGLTAEAWALPGAGHPQVAGHADADVVALRHLAHRLRQHRRRAPWSRRPVRRRRRPRAGRTTTLEAPTA